MTRLRTAFPRIAVVAFLVGALTTASGLAGVVTDPFGLGSRGTPGPDQHGLEEATERAQGLAQAGSGPNAGIAHDRELAPEEIPAVAAAEVKAPSGAPLPDGQFLVGASRASLTPTPTLFGGSTWQREGCTIYGTEGEPNLDVDHAVTSMEDLRGWPAASPDCIYLGGFGIGPVRPAQRVGQGGVWVRAIAISNGETTFVYAIADTVGWFARYDAGVCPTDDCGILDVRERAAGDLGVPIENLVVGSTHSHAGADTYGGWGGIPTWYRAQLRDAAVAAVKQAVRNLEPATLTVGDSTLRDRNNERRDTYYSNADTGATWLQARDAEGETVATWATFAAHPTIVGEPILHADWPGAAARRFEARYGGVGLLFEGGLGNVSVSGAGGASDEEEAENTGIAVADAIGADVDAQRGHPLSTNDMAASVQVIKHPATTNPGLITLASAGLFDREFTAGTKGAGLPGTYSWSKQGETSSAGEDNDVGADPGSLRSCASAGPTVITTAGAHRIDRLAVAFGPGELFSTLAEVVKERADKSAVTMVLGQSNDALGYIIQSFEYDTAANAVTEYGTQTHEYEEVFSIDRCFGDHVLETLLEATGALGFGR